MYNKIKTALTQGLSSYQIKLIALFFMTIDHIGIHSYKIPGLVAYRNLMRGLGRIAAPLFLFMVIESARHTKDRKRFLRRLYLAGVGMGLFTSITNLLSTLIIKTSSSPGNIFYTFFFTVLYIYLIEAVIKAVKERNGRNALKSAACFLLTFVPTVFFIFFEGKIRLAVFEASNQNYVLMNFVGDLFEAVLPEPLGVDYSCIFVLMGILMYFAKTKIPQCAVFAAFCALCYVSAAVNFTPLSSFYGTGTQHWMILALPFMLLYNGKRGAEHKAFFYLYYPLHYLVIYAISTAIETVFIP